MNTNTIIAKAQHSKFYLWLLNRALNRMVPFNAPHRFTVVEISGFKIRILLPYRRRNWNHIRGLHACALATVSEFATGFTLVSRLDPKKYRLIMQRLEMDYHYQGKMDAFAEFEISEQWMEEMIYTPLMSAESVVVPCQVKVHDRDRNLLTTGLVYWQIKDWRKVRTAA